MPNFWCCTIKLHNRSGTALVLADKYIWSNSAYDTRPDTSWSAEPRSHIKSDFDELVEFGQQSGGMRTGARRAKNYWFGGAVQYALDLEKDWKVDILWEWPTEQDGESPVHLSCPPGYFIRATKISGDRWHVTVELDLEDMITTRPLSGGSIGKWLPPASPETS